MSGRRIVKFRPGLEWLEPKQLLSVGFRVPLAQFRGVARAAMVEARREALRHAALVRAGRHPGALPDLAAGQGLARGGRPAHHASPIHAPYPMIEGITADRITNPPANPASVSLRPPFFKRVAVQSIKPVPGRHYNVVFVSLYNRTGRTLTAQDGIAVRLTVQQGPVHFYPILTGDERFRPGQTMVLYFLTKRTYTDLFSPPASAGFTFNFRPPENTAIPGPSGFYHDIVYNPATFDRVLDAIVAFGPGTNGHLLGIGDTALWELLPVANADLL